MTNNNGVDPRFRWVRAHPLLGKLVAWTIIISLFAGVAAITWYKITIGEAWKVLVIGTIACLGGWHAYKQARRAARD